LEELLYLYLVVQILRMQEALLLLKK